VNWRLPELPTARHAMHEHSSTYITGKRDAVLRQATIHTVHIPGRWHKVTYCSWTRVLHGVCGSQVADAQFYSYLCRCAYCN